MSPSVTLVFLNSAVVQSDLLILSKSRPTGSRDMIVSSQEGFGILDFACLLTGDRREIIVRHIEVAIVERTTYAYL